MSYLDRIGCKWDPYTYFSEVSKAQGAQALANIRVHHTQDEQIAELQGQVNELRLYMAAALQLLAAKGVVEPREIAQYVDKVDKADGQADGKFEGPVGPKLSSMDTDVMPAIREDTPGGQTTSEGNTP